MIFFFLFDFMATAANHFNNGLFEADELVQKTDHQKISWFDKMTYLHKILDRYVTKKSGITRIHIGVLTFLSSIKEFDDLLHKINDGKVIKPFCNFLDEKREEYLDQLDNDLEDMGFEISLNAADFLDKIRKTIVGKTYVRLQNWKYLIGLYNMTSDSYSNEDQMYNDLFSTMYDKLLFFYGYEYAYCVTRKDLENAKGKRENYVTKAPEQIITTPKYLFLQCCNKNGNVRQKDIRSFEHLTHAKDNYAITGIFLQNEETLSNVFLIKIDGEWATFENDNYRWDRVEFSYPWHVTLFMYKRDPSTKKEK